MAAEQPLRIHDVHPGRKDQLKAADDVAADRLIDIKELCSILSIGRSTAERWLAAGRLPAPIKLSRTCHRWQSSVIREWIANGCPDPREQEGRR